MKKNILTIFIALAIGIILSNYAISEYRNSKTNNVLAKSKNVYLYQYGAYKSKEIMSENCANLENYFYYLEKDLYHVLLAISSNNNLNDKLKKAYKIENDLYVKKINITNSEFLENLKQYDQLLENTDDNEVIINAEKQILAKYDSLILNGQNTN